MATRRGARRESWPSRRWNGCRCCPSWTQRTFARLTGRRSVTRSATRSERFAPRSESDGREEQHVSECRARYVDDHIIDIGTPVAVVECDRDRELAELNRHRQSESCRDDQKKRSAARNERQ